MKKIILMLFIAFSLLSCNSEDTPNDPNRGIHPPDWIQGTWLEGPVLLEAGWKFTPDNVYLVDIESGNVTETPAVPVLSNTVGSFSDDSTFEIRESSNPNSARIFLWHKLSSTQIEEVNLLNYNNTVFTKQ